MTKNNKLDKSLDKSVTERWKRSSGRQAPELFTV